MALRISFIILACVSFSALFLPSHEFNYVEGDAWKYDCTKEGDGSSLTVKLSTTTPIRGETVVMDMAYFLKEDLIKGTVAVSVEYGVVHFFSNTYDLCTLGVVQCPVKAGNGTAVFKHTVASYQPLGTYTVHANIYNQNKKELACIEMVFRISE